ncbi:hypothetical protein [Streptomyces sp. NPDC053720]|uniref:nSTAND1 domain-containing NTPase n=1 Tax=Streptomyces sp. NPDC053720 TaxID=3154855 RepID=UPI0034153328
MAGRRRRRQRARHPRAGPPGHSRSQAFLPPPYEEDVFTSGRSPTKSPLSPGRFSAPTPFPDLGPFSEEDAEVFFGREEDTKTVVSALRVDRAAVTLRGPSGGGKSSLALTGVASVRVVSATRWWPSTAAVPPVRWVPWRWNSSDRHARNGSGHRAPPASSGSSPG